MRFAPKLSPLAAALLLAGLSPLALAQTPPPADPKDEPKGESARGVRPRLEPVIVTASKRQEAAHKLPYNVTAIGEQALRDENITDLKSLIKDSMHVDAPQNSARFTDSVTVRGLNISSVSANNIEWFSRSTLSYYLDDAPLPNIGYRIKDVARVETLMGPQGTLYGGGALGGTIRYITNKPALGKTEGRLSTSLYQTRHGGLSKDIDGVLNVPLGDSLALRVVLAKLDEAGYTDRFAGKPAYLTSPWQPKPDRSRSIYQDDDYQDVKGGRVSLRWKISPDMELTLSHAQQDQLAHGTSGAQLLPASGNGRYTAPLAFDQQTVLSPYDEFSNRDFRMSTLDFDWNLGFARLHSSTSTFKDNRIGQADYLATGSFFYGTLGYSPFRLGSSSWLGNTAFITFDNRYKGTLHETRLVSAPGALSWVAGFYYADQQRSQQFSEWMPGFEPFKSTAGRGRTDEGYFENQASDYTETALYGEATWKATDALSLIAGARLFSYKDNTTTQVEDYAFDLVDGVVKGNEKDSGNSYFKLGASYQVQSDVLAYATFSQGFRRGGANGFRGFGGAQVNPALQRFAADSTDNLELGLKGYLMDRQLYLQGNVYRINWKDPQTYFSQDINGFPVWGTTNGPAAYSQGLEFQARWAVSPSFELRWASTYTQAEWDGTKEVCLYADNTECRTYSKGGRLGGSAPWKHTAGFTVRGTVSDIDWWFSGTARYIGVKASDRGDDPADKPFEYKAYTTLRASLGASFGAWDVSVWGNNLADNRELVSFQGTSAVGTRTGIRAIYLTPRTVGVNVSYRF